jgi:hypothetical protein
VGRNALIRSVVFVAVVFGLLILVGSTITSAPADNVVEADRQPTTTTTTEPPPPGVTFIVIANGSFSPSILAMDLNEVQIVEWTNEDPLEYILSSSTEEWEPVTLNKGDQFEFDFSTLEVGIHRFHASIGFNKIPGSVDTRPDQ